MMTITKYVVFYGVPGCLPDGMEDTFDTEAEALAYITEQLEDEAAEAGIAAQDASVDETEFNEFVQDRVEDLRWKLYIEELDFESEEEFESWVQDW